MVIIALKTTLKPTCYSRYCAAACTSRTLPGTLSFLLMHHWIQAIVFLSVLCSIWTLSTGDVMNVLWLWDNFFSILMIVLCFSIQSISFLSWDRGTEKYNNRNNYDYENHRDSGSNPPGITVLPYPFSVFGFLTRLSFSLHYNYGMLHRSIACHIVPIVSRQVERPGILILLNNSVQRQEWCSEWECRNCNLGILSSS